MKQTKMKKQLNFFWIAAVAVALVSVTGCKDDNGEDGIDKKLKKGSPFTQSVINSISFETPNNSNTNVFDIPVIKLRFAPDVDTIVGGANVEQQTYKVCIEEMYLMNTAKNEKEDCRIEKSEDGLQYRLIKGKPFESNGNYMVYVKATIKQQTEEGWKTILDKDGNEEYFEERKIEFSVGERPQQILSEHIEYAYPINYQYNFLPKESAEAYIITSVDYSYLFEGNGIKGQITDLNGGAQPFDCKYNTANAQNGVYEIDFDFSNIQLDNDKIYNLALKNADKTLYSIYFRTSRYNTFIEKMSCYETSNPAILIWLGGSRYKIYNHLKVVDNSVINESFDRYDYSILEYTNTLDYSILVYTNTLDAYAQKSMPDEVKKLLNDNLIQVFLDYSNCEYFTERLSAPLYENNDIISVLGKIAPPVSNQIIILENRQGEDLLTEEMILNDSRLVINENTVIDINNYIAEYLNKDFYKYRTKLVNTNAPEGVKEFLKWNDPPSLVYGNYPLIFKYKLPGKNIYTSEVRFDVIIDETSY